MINKIRIIFFILFSLYSAFFFIGSTLTPITAHFKFYDLSAKLTSLYVYSCHQQPDRSFWLLGYPVSLCCRCYGVYISTTISSIFAIFNKLKISKFAIILLILISVVDIFINLGIRTNSHNTGNFVRFSVGIMIGLLITLGINGLFNMKRRIKNGN